MEPDHGSDRTRYRSQVRARMRRQPGSRAWTSLKNGFGGLFLAAGDGVIEINAPGVPVRLARLLGVDYVLTAAEVTLNRARVGWLGTRLFERECLVLTWSKGARTTQLAINPVDRDLSRLESALIAAGARTASGVAR